MGGVLTSFSLCHHADQVTSLWGHFLVDWLGLGAYYKHPFSAFNPSTINHKDTIKILERNDADVVGVRNGCSFTGWTGSGFDEDSFTLNAGVTDRWKWSPHVTNIRIFGCYNIYNFTIITYLQLIRSKVGGVCRIPAVHCTVYSTVKYSTVYRKFEERILYLQCNCRGKKPV